MQIITAKGYNTDLVVLNYQGFVFSNQGLNLGYGSVIDWDYRLSRVTHIKGSFINYELLRLPHMFVQGIFILFN